MSNNLLITMGCSYTEGAGCHGHADPEFMERMKLLASNLNDITDIYQQSEWQKFILSPKTLKRQQDYGWPSQLAGPLNRNLVNLGRGGDSNSAQVKLLYESDTYTGQDVLVVFLATAIERFSFYQKNSPRSYMPVMANESFCSDTKERLFVEYYVRSQDLEQGSQREAEFYIRAAEALCQARGWRFVWLPAFSHYDYQGSNRLHPDILAYEWLIKPRDFALCSHPNERGYKIIAENLLALIKEFYTPGAKNF